MSAGYERPMTADEIAAIADADIDFSDIPELDDVFWSRARLIEPASAKPG